MSKRKVPKSAFFISGPKEDYVVPDLSMGKYLFDCLKRRDYDYPINIDGVTGKIATNGYILENSVKMVQVLQNFHIKKNDVIAIMCENSINYCLPVVAALYMGVTVSTLNPNYTMGELRHVLKLSQPKMIICNEDSMKNLLTLQEEFDFIKMIVLLETKSENNPDAQNLVDLLETITADVENYKPEEFEPTEQDALILLSSGTTGLPKGVVITHANLRAPLSYVGDAQYASITSHDTTVSVLPFFHIFGLVLELSAIVYGMKMVILDKFKPDIYLRNIQDYKATKLFTVPPLLLFLAKSPLIDEYKISNLEDIFCGAAPVGKDTEDAARSRFKSTRVRQMYGMTEVTGGCTFVPPDCPADKIGTAGKLVPGMTAKVWDPEKKENVGPRQTGELCIRGSMIMKGYIRNAEETKDSIDEDGFYHSGDIAYYDEDGYFYIIDRLKELIKYKGFQVAPAELENLIMTYPGVKDCGVIGIPDEKAGQLPMAFVVRQIGVNVTEKDIADHVAANISIEKHLYGGVRFVEVIPRNPSGKILRKNLMQLFKPTQ